MKKRIFSLLVIFLLAAILPLAAEAADHIPDSNREDCSIDVVLWDRK